MKFATIMVLACSMIAHVEANLFPNVLATILQPDQLLDIVTGYIDGLLQVNLKQSQHNCDYYKRHAKKSFELALDDWDRANDFWLSWNKKIKLTEDGLAKILNVTPQIIIDIHDHCD